MENMKQLSNKIQQEAGAAEYIPHYNQVWGKKNKIISVEEQSFHGVSGTRQKNL